MCEKRQKLTKFRSLEWDQAERSSINTLEPYNCFMLLPRSAPFLQTEICPNELLHRSGMGPVANFSTLQ